MNVEHSAEKGLPDFNALATSSIYTAKHWRMAWDELDEPDLWPTLLELARTNAQPVCAARALRSAMTLRPLSPGADHEVYRCECETDAHEKPHTYVLPPEKSEL